MNRRHLLKGLLLVPSAPAIVRAEWIMPVKAVRELSGYSMDMEGWITTPLYGDTKIYKIAYIPRRLSDEELIRLSS